MPSTLKCAAVKVRPWRGCPSEVSRHARDTIRAGGLKQSRFSNSVSTGKIANRWPLVDERHEAAKKKSPGRVILFGALL
jgi:hypothetical protein